MELFFDLSYCICLSEAHCISDGVSGMVLYMFDLNCFNADVARIVALHHRLLLHAVSCHFEVCRCNNPEKAYNNRITQNAC
jgi:hypothetical protein